MSASAGTPAMTWAGSTPAVDLAAQPNAAQPNAAQPNAARRNAAQPNANQRTIRAGITSGPMMPITAATAAAALEPVRRALAALDTAPGQRGAVGLVPGLIATDRTDVRPTTQLTSGAAIDSLLEAAQRRWQASPQAAAALAWKSYTYWLALPTVLGYATARRVVLLRPDTVVATWSPAPPLVTFGLASVQLAVLASDPLIAPVPPASIAAVSPESPALPSVSGPHAAIPPADGPHGAIPHRTGPGPHAATPHGTGLNNIGTVPTVASDGVLVLPDESALLAAMRATLIDEHLAPMLEHIRARVNLGQRTLLGSIASGIAHGISRAAAVLPAPAWETATSILSALGLDDLVEIAPLGAGEAGLSIQRKTCCLAFTLPEPKICSGCCIGRG